MIRDPGARIAGVRRLAFLLATLAAALAAPAAAAPFSVRLGLDRIVVDAPPGFSDTTDLASPRLQDLAATLTSESNRILVFALTDADLRRFMLGDQLEARRYMIAVTPRASEREYITRAQWFRGRWRGEPAAVARDREHGGTGARAEVEVGKRATEGG